MRARPFRQRFSRPVRTRDGGKHWIGWNVEGSLVAENTFANAQVILPGDYEVAANLQASATIVISIGGIVIVGTAGPNGGQFGLGVFDGDFGVPTGQADLGFTSLTDERWLTVGSWGVGLGTPFTRMWRSKQRVKMKDHQLIFSVSDDILSGATHGTVEYQAWGRHLLVNI